jgi:hypothetical protein
MRSRRYTIVLADRRSGVVRRFTIGLWPTLATVTGIMALPVLIGAGAAWKAKYDVADLFVTAAALGVENPTIASRQRALGRSKGAAGAGRRARALDPTLQSAWTVSWIIRNRGDGRRRHGARGSDEAAGVQSPRTRSSAVGELGA